MHQDGAIEWRYIPIDHLVKGKPRYVAISIVADAAHATAYLATTIANRLSISPDPVTTFTALGTDITSGFDLGAFTVGQRKDYIIKIDVGTGVDAREEFYGLEIGEGT
jgi:nanoRNase/pAp phosphatase (c-di-AMP/oligoRNAs hydrolase)